MTTIIILFLIAAAISLLVTPMVVRFAFRWELLDHPSARKVHDKPTPAIGGVSIFCAFYLSFVVAACWPTVPLRSLFEQAGLVWIVIGTVIAFGVGLWDDIHPIGPWRKLILHLLAALIAVTGGGVRIDQIVLPSGIEWVFGWLSIPISVLWIVLVMNAVNLIDGLDGLAAGLVVIASMVLLVLCMMADMILPALILAALSGASFGFLRYNYYPASIFMGNGGSYFLGFIIGAVAIVSSIKSQAAVTILIPMIVLTVPLTDTFYAVIRRLLVKRKIFKADQEHIHHRLLRQGFSQQLAVFILYGITLVLGVGAMLLVFFRDERAGLLLLLMGMGMVLAVGRMDILKSYGLGTLQGWVAGVLGTLKMNGKEPFNEHLKRIFSDIQNIETLWRRMQAVAARLELDQMDFYVQPDVLSGTSDNSSGTAPASFSWCHDSARIPKDVPPDKLLKMNIPLYNADTQYLGSVVFYRNFQNRAMAPQTLIQVEQFRRALVRVMEKLMRIDSESETR